MKIVKKPLTNRQIYVTYALCGCALLLSAYVSVPLSAQDNSPSKEEICLSNLKKIGTATAMYANDYDGRLFPVKTAIPNPFAGKDGVAPSASKYTFFHQLLQSYLKDWNVWKCPGNPSAWVNQELPKAPGQPLETITDYQSYGGQNSYGVNNYLFMGDKGSAIAEIAQPTMTFLLLDARYHRVLPQNPTAVEGVRTTGEYAAYWKNLGNGYYFRAKENKVDTPDDEESKRMGRGRHKGNIHVLYVDGHTESLPYSEVLSGQKRWLPAAK